MAEASQRTTLPPQGKEPLAREAQIDRFEAVLRVSHEQAVKLQEAGFQEPNDVRSAPDEQLQKLDFSPDDIKRLKEGEPLSSDKSDALLEKWLQDRQARRQGKGPLAARKPKAMGNRPPPSADMMKRWVEGDDSAIDAWIKEDAAASTSASGSPPTPGTVAPVPTPGATSAPVAPAPGGAPVPVPIPETAGSTSAPGPSAAPSGPTPIPTGPAATPEVPGTVRPDTAADPNRAARPAPLRQRSPAAAPASAGPSVAEAEIRAREETVLRWLTELLDKAKSDTFDPAQLLREAQDLTRQLHEERSRRRELEEELEHVKKGSVAVIKYVRNREARAREEAIASKEAEILELRRQVQSARASGSSADTQQVLAERDTRIHALEDELEKSKSAAGTSAGAQHEMSARFEEEMEAKDRAFAEKEAELRRKVIKLDEELQKLRSERELTDRHAQLTKLDTKNLTSELKSKLEAVEGKERALSQREAEFKSKIEELMVRADEFEKKRAPLAYKETELIKWEEELRLKEQTLTAQLRELETSKKEAMSPEAMSKLKRLEDIQAEIQKKEDELRTRETFLNQKLEELERKERNVTDQEIEKAKEDLKAEVSANKVKTGVPRLDDLLLGGVPLGTNVLVNAPSHTGKDVMARLMAAEGLKKGVPVLWILSDKATTTVREEMTVVLPSYPEYEKKGLVRYVDLYSMTLNIPNTDPLVVMLSPEDKGFLDGLTKAVDEIAAEFRKKADYYRLLFETISTVTAYSGDATSSFRFLQPFVGKRKRDKAVSYYLVDTGMHSDNDIQVLEHMMDGSVNLKVDQLKTYLSVKGLGEVQSRAWISYTFTKKVFNIGSFSLDHIR